MFHHLSSSGAESGGFAMGQTAALEHHDKAVETKIHENACLQLDSLFHAMIPDEVKLHIFAQLEIPDLGIAAQTCKVWRELAMDRSLWACGFTTLPRGSEDENAPSQRVCHTSVLKGNRIIIYGGHCPSPGSNYITNVKSDMYSYDIEARKWEEIDSEPMERTEHAAIMYEGRMLVVAGYTGDSYTSDISAYDFEKNEWEHFPAVGAGAPSPRSACCVAIWQDKLFMFGGWNGHESNNDFYYCDLKTNQWARIPESDGTPDARRSACCVQWRDAMYIWSGFGTMNNCSSKVYKFNFLTMSWENTKEPSNNNAHSSVPAPRSRSRALRVYDRMIICGGWDRVNHFNDWWEYNLSSETWTKRDIKLPQLLAQHSGVVYQNSVIMFGGFDDSLKHATDSFWQYHLGHLEVNSA